MIILATIPVGLVGLVFEHEFRVLFGKPIRAAIFLVINGLILLAGEKFRRKASVRADAGDRAGAGTGGRGPAGPADRARPGTRPATRPSGQAEYEPRRSSRTSGCPTQGYLSALHHRVGADPGAAGRASAGTGSTMVAGMFRGLSREDAARFAFLLATPVILAAGVLKVPDLTGPLGKGIHGQILVGSVLSGVGAYLSVRFLITLLPDPDADPVRRSTASWSAWAASSTSAS